ncbi:lipase/ esterase [Gloeophyllum trabeum ATCC 11539]|uniref:Lipase/ esterase n=1 Tax=Gloeophyllum trabeum (strain ATCC 11539 / FP-39264 / Madison 617) TaxID=670483 RepID=S7QMQ1_GLOTA|nr:lipase/ esterase [Gloeophyllum trabeum ATCC 11539]EPQ60667.1 lipase/ esterase [Gloeophyllum trabeum ATCC 11539]
MATVYQPLHDDIVSRLDPEYAAFHKEHLLYTPLQHQLPWDPAIRQRPTVPGGSEPLKVGSTRDIALSKFSVRVYTPEGAPPEKGWPVILYFHGGGWTLGNIGAEAGLCTNMCKRAKCVVVSVDYRLAPENPHPAAVEDAVEALKWLYSKGKAEINIDTDSIAVGGSSSGGNLAAILGLKASQLSPPVPIKLQLLLVPVTDNTADATGATHASWRENKDTVWLDVHRMEWFKRNYLPNKEDWTKWDASPLFAPEELVRKAPRAWVAVCEMDILRDEGLAYGERLRKAGVEVETQVYKGAPHHVMAMDG